MNNLADRVIQANEDSAPEQSEGPKLDDIGFPLPKPQTEKAFCEYLTARLLYLNKRVYKYRGMLWLHDDVIKENKATYYRMAKYPSQITDVQCAYVWRRLKEFVPELDTDIIAVLPDWTFNMRTGEFKNESVWTTTPWDEDDDNY